MRANPIDRSVVMALFAYDPETGVFLNKIGRKRARAGAVAGYVASNGYRYLALPGGRKLLAQRVAWVIVYDQQPVADVDHENGRKDDNRLLNLRGGTRSENCFSKGLPSNNTSGHRGVWRDKRNGKWRAEIKRLDRRFNKKSRLSGDTILQSFRRRKMIVFRVSHQSP